MIALADEKTDIVLRRDKHDFKLRVTGVLFNQNGDIAVNEEPQYGYLTLPGGKIKFGETSQQAVVREFAEEMGIRVQGTKLLSVTENLFSFEGKLNNEVCFTWLVVKIDNQTVYAKDDWEQTLVWRSLNSISNLKPHALQAVLNNLPTQVVHLINIDKGE